MDMVKLREVLADEAFVKLLFAQEKPEQVQLMLEEKGISISIDEIEKVGEMLTKIQNEELDAIQSGVLTEEQLEMVAGGCLWFCLLGAVLTLAAIFGGSFLSFGRTRW